MKTVNWMYGLLIAGLCVFSGCSKKQTEQPAGSEFRPLHAAPLRAAFKSSTPENQAVVDKVIMSIQASMYQDALAGLDKLAATPGLSEEQKKAVADLTPQVAKRVAPPSQPPGQ
jgi:hypothetical protein